MLLKCTDEECPRGTAWLRTANSRLFFFFSRPQHIMRKLTRLLLFSCVVSFFLFFLDVWRYVCHIVIRTDDIIHKIVMCEQKGSALIWSLLSLFWIKETIRQIGLLLHSAGGFGSFFFFFYLEKVHQVINTLSDGNLGLGQLWRRPSSIRRTRLRKWASFIWTL